MSEILPGSRIKLNGRVNEGMKMIERILAWPNIDTMSKFSWASRKILFRIDDNQPEIGNKHFRIYV